MDNTRNVECPDCGSNVSLTGPLEIGNTTVCPDCDAVLKIVGINPLNLEVESEDNQEEDDNGEDNR